MPCACNCVIYTTKLYHLLCLHTTLCGYEQLWSFQCHGFAPNVLPVCYCGHKKSGKEFQLHADPEGYDLPVEAVVRPVILADRYPGSCGSRASVLHAKPRSRRYRSARIQESSVREESTQASRQSGADCAEKNRRRNVQWPAFTC